MYAAKNGVTLIMVSTMRTVGLLKRRGMKDAAKIYAHAVNAVKTIIVVSAANAVKDSAVSAANAVNSATAAT